MKKAWVLSYLLSAQGRVHSEESEADPSLHWAHSHFVGFVMRLLNCIWNCYSATMNFSKSSSCQLIHYSFQVSFYYPSRLFHTLQGQPNDLVISMYSSLLTQVRIFKSTAGRDRMFKSGTLNQLTMAATHFFFCLSGIWDLFCWFVFFNVFSITLIANNKGKIISHRRTDKEGIWWFAYFSIKTYVVGAH